MDEEIKLLKIRLANTEKALIGLAVLLETISPSERTEAVSHMMTDYFNANESLGADFSERDHLFEARSKEHYNG